MKTLLKPLLAALCLLALSAPALAQYQPRAYAPEDLRSLSYNDQVRVIRLEYREQSGGREIADDQLRFYVDQVNRSNWRFSDIKRDISKSLAGSTGPGPLPGGAIRCESPDNRSRVCRTPWSGPSRLSRQISDTRCEESRNWSSQNGQVTVWGGCRAEFVEGWGGGQGGAIRCESPDNRSRVCRTPWSGPSRLSRQISDTRCEEGRNWSSQNGQVTVWSGCRAEFVEGWGGGQGGTIRCESADNRVANCRTPWRGRSQLVRQLSDRRCVEGQNWSSNNGQVNVWAGCRGEFARAGSGSGGGDNGYTVTCASQNGGYTTCNWPPGQGRPRLIQQLSTQACIEGRTWGMAGSNRIWVNGGCRARFGN
ncbi:DUF3011 domain-containing protein [Lysobacter solisilvae (ex Woo and Kim 2020)]|uniref:DUF3011 domain-containing protein n=1 Tax=Agrilutibacter terrestris TaxID=2865112 RepID=A0A7H0FZ34_9GAMM|nr:DUF3011 domain-containing protein [Lysobacter terrestris]QNP41300.1 DUF3011 domain-containing protein [Lysobacter terrestris]